MFRTILLAGLGAGVIATSACSTTPQVTREAMTLGEVNIEGMECRKDRPPDTNIPRTICASPEAWAAFDDRRRRETNDLLVEIRRYPNFGRFNRD